MLCEAVTGDLQEIGGLRHDGRRQVGDPSTLSIRILERVTKVGILRL